MTSSLSSGEPKIPLKQAEISVRRFNESALPQHLSLLRNHRSNIEKSLALGDWNKIKKEEINAMRVIKQLKNLLLEMDSLRERVRDEDLKRFDALMEVGKKQAFEGMRQYLELQLKSPTNNLRSPQDRNGSLADDDDDDDASTRNAADIGATRAHQRTVPQIEADFELQKYQLSQRQACLEELESLQYEIRDLNGMFHGMRELVQEQAESVQAIADNSEEALEQVQAGESNLRRALTYKKAMYPVMGALLGTCLGGPIGLVAGLKAGGLAAVSCGILGFTGGSVLKGNAAVMQGNIEEAGQQQQQQGHQFNGDNNETIEMVKKQE